MVEWLIKHPFVLALHGSSQIHLISGVVGNQVPETGIGEAKADIALGTRLLFRNPQIFPARLIYHRLRLMDK